MPRFLDPQPLTPEAFAPFGDVLGVETKTPLIINEGFAERFDDLAQISVAGNGGRPRFSLFRAKARRYPMEITMMERHPIGSQAFFPTTGAGFLVLVAPPTDTLPFPGMTAFRARADQGVNYHPGVWHFPLLAEREGDLFVVVDRAGGGDLEIATFTSDFPVLRS